MRKIYLLLLLTVLLVACSQTSSNKNTESPDDRGEFVEYSNPPAEGFNQESSDAIATLLADKVMNAMGGRQAWDNTRYISWNFFGKRKHVWDKWEGNVRIEQPDTELTILMNINTGEGRIMSRGEELTHADSLAKYLDMGKRFWINDAYWLVMPYKLKDTGVTLTYIGEDTTQEGALSDVVRLSFENIGVTPQNIYEVWIDAETKFVTQWAYYVDIEQEEPRFITPWADYQQYGEIMLSGNRGKSELSNIKVLTSVPTGILSF